jgi:prophage antirepressor-like protein
MSARDLIPFSFDHHNIRVVTGDDGEPLFVGKDICEALGYANPPDAITRHCKGVVKRYPLQTAGGVQDLRVLSESDVMRLIVGSTLPAAQEFERWVYEKVLPSIRKTGSFGAAVTFGDEIMLALRMTPAAVRAARALGLDRNAAAIGANQLVHKLTGQNLLKEFGSTHLVAENQETQWFTPTQLSGQAGPSAAKVNQLLASAGFQVAREKVWELLDAGRPFARLYDTGKKHNSGVPVQQIKWSPAVIEAARKVSGQGG